MEAPRSVDAIRAVPASRTSTLIRSRPRSATVLCAITLVTLWLALPSQASAQATPSSPYSAHSMIYAYSMPMAQKERIFAEAKAMGASHIRLDIELHAVFKRYRRNWVDRDWRGVDEVVALSRRYAIPVLAILIGVPEFISVCHDDEAEKCAASDMTAYGRYAGEVAERTRGEINLFEIINEPDSNAMFRGSAEDYARMLSAAYREIKLRSPASSVLIGGVSGTIAKDWLGRVFATPGAAAATKFDIANVHVRGGVTSLPRSMAMWRSLFAAHGRGSAPLWVTEHGYPADTAYQDDPRYRGGEAAQASFLRDSLPTLIRAGARQIFVSTRDTWPEEFGLHSPFNSEGVTSVSDNAPYSVRRRPASGVVRSLAGKWPQVPLTVPELGRLTAARNTHAITCFRTTGTRDKLVTRTAKTQRAVKKLRAAVKRATRRHKRRQASALRRKVRVSLRSLTKMKRQYVTAKAGAAATCELVRAYQAKLTAGV